MVELLGNGITPVDRRIVVEESSPLLFEGGKVSDGSGKGLMVMVV